MHSYCYCGFQLVGWYCGSGGGERGTGLLGEGGALPTWANLKLAESHLIVCNYKVPTTEDSHCY